MSAKVSIIISCHNKENYVADAIKSAISQTWENIELIIVDDDSSDKSIDIINKYKGEKVQIFYQKFHNAAATRNFGLHKSSGAFIQFLDADDLIHPEKIALQLKEMNFEFDSIGVCNTKSFYSSINDEGKEVDTDFLRNETVPLFFLKRMYADPNQGMVQPNAWLTPRRTIEKAGLWNENLSLDDDGEFFCRILLNSRNVVHTDKVLNYYRRFKSDENLSSNKSCEGFHSMLQSALLKRKHLECFLKDYQIKEEFSTIYNTLLGHVMTNSYPWCKKVSTEAEAQIDFSAPVLLPKFGGFYIEMIKKIFGWKFAKQLQISKALFLIK